MKRSIVKNTELMMSYLKSIKTADDLSLCSDLELSMEIHHGKQCPCIWESGGSWGNKGSAIVILDNNFRTQQPLVCAKPRNLYNDKHALIKTWPGCNVLGGYFEDDKFTCGVFTVVEFRFDHNLNQNIAVLNITDLITLDRKELSDYLPYNGIDHTLANEYTWTASDFKRVPTILLQKLCTYMAMYPLCIKHWRPIYSGKEAKRLLADHSDNKLIQPSPSLHQFYDSILKEAQIQRKKSNRSTHLSLTLHRIDEDLLDVIGTLVEKKINEEDRALTTIVPIEDSIQHVIHLELNRLRTFWYPDQDPWQKNKGVLPNKILVGKMNTRIYEFLG